MLSDWLSKSLDAASASLPSDGRIHGGHYRIEAPGVLRLTPDHVSPHARACVLSAGIHGNETAPIELLGDCLHALRPASSSWGLPCW